MLMHACIRQFLSVGKPKVAACFRTYDDNSLFSSFTINDTRSGNLHKLTEPQEQGQSTNMKFGNAE